MAITASILRPVDDFESKINIPICVQSSYNKILGPICEENGLFLLSDFGIGVDVGIDIFPQFEREVGKFLMLLTEQDLISVDEKMYFKNRLENLIIEMKVIFSERPNVEFSIG